MKKNTKQVGKGILNTVIDKLPIELHLPGYQFCGPGTKLKERLAAGQKGINGLDSACRVHDIAYNNYKNPNDRKIADMLLIKQALGRLSDKKTGVGEKLAALTVAGLMKTKSILGSGIRAKKNVKKVKKVKTVKKVKKVEKETPIKIGNLFRTAVKNAKMALTNQNPKTMNDAIRVATQAAKSTIKNKNQSELQHDNIQRVIPVPKIGGLLPLIPIFAGLSALGALTGGSAAVANAVLTANNAKQRLKESERHNQMMEAIALGKNKRGDGVYLKPYRKGLGLYTQKKMTTKNF